MGAPDVNAASFEELQQYIATEDSGRTLAVMRMWRDADRAFAGLHEDLSGAERRYLDPNSWRGEAADVFRRNVLRTRNSLALFQGDVVVQQLDVLASKTDWAKSKMAELQAQWNRQMAQAGESHIAGMIGALYGRSSAPGTESYTITVAGHSYPVHVTHSDGQDTAAQQAQSRAGETQAQAHEIARVAQQLIRDELTKQARFAMGQLASAYVDASDKITGAAATFNFDGPLNAMASGLPGPGPAGLSPGTGPGPGGGWPSGAVNSGGAHGGGGPASGPGSDHGGGAGQRWPDGAVRTSGPPSPQGGDPGQNSGPTWSSAAVDSGAGGGNGGDGGWAADAVTLGGLAASSAALRGGGAPGRRWPRGAVDAARGTDAGSSRASNVLRGARDVSAGAAPGKATTTANAGFDEESPGMRPPVAPGQTPKAGRGTTSTVESARTGVAATGEEPAPTLGGRRSAAKRGEHEGTGRPVRIGAQDAGQPREIVAPRIAGRTGETAVAALRVHELPGSPADPSHGATREPEPSLGGHAGKPGETVETAGGASIVTHGHPVADLSIVDESAVARTDLAGRARAMDATAHLVLPVEHDRTEITGRLAGHRPVVPDSTLRRQRGSQQPVEVEQPDEESWTAAGGGKAVVDTPLTPDAERTASPALGRTVT